MGSPKSRKAFWGEAEQRNERETTFRKKVAASEMQLATTIWRRGWDSNPRTLAGHLISSQGRYDRFDTSPYSIFIPGGFDSGAVKAK
jgi:hypothetical protein